MLLCVHLSPQMFQVLYLKVTKIWTHEVPLLRHRNLKSSLLTVPFRFLIMISLLLVIVAILAIATAQLDSDGHCISGSAAKKGDTIGVHYSGYIDKSSATGEHGKMFDSSLKRGPFTFQLGAGKVIQGWEKG